MDAPTPPATKQSRRTVLAAGVGAAVAALAGALGRPSVAKAADGDPVLIGQTSGTSGTTHIQKIDANYSGVAFAGEAYGTGIGVIGMGGTTGTGIYGWAEDSGAYGVKATNSGGTAMYGRADPWGYAGVHGASTLGFGVMGESHVGDTTGTGTAGVWGRDYADAKGIGTYGTSINGIGVYGRVAATANQNFPAPPSANIGVLGEAVGTGTVAVQAVNAQGLALKASGKVHFSRSGKATVSATKNSVVVAAAGVTTASMIWAMLSDNRSGIWVRAVVPAAGSFTIYLNNTVASSTRVAWFVLD